MTTKNSGRDQPWAAADDTTPHLFSPLRIAGVETPNRIVVSPMCMYAAQDGLANDYHLVHLGKLALGGAGIVIVEATAIEERGRISHHDLGIWRDDQANRLAPIAQFISNFGAIPGIQLGHAGRKAAAQAPWDGGGPLGSLDAARGEPPWPVIAPSAQSAGPGWQTPAAMTESHIIETIDAWRDAAVRAHHAGFAVIDLHGAHGYLLHSFLSPISNTRVDEWGGSLERRMRYPLEVVRTIRAAVPRDVAIFYRTSCVDGIDGGISIEDTVAFARHLSDAGVDVVDCSSGGLLSDRMIDTRIRRGFAFHADFSSTIRAQAGVPTATVGLIVDPVQAESALVSGDADLVMIGRELLSNPNWPHHARRALDPKHSFDKWHREVGWWLHRREPILEELSQSGESPLSRYESGIVHGRDAAVGDN